MEKEKCVVLSDKREILLNDDDSISLSMISNGKTIHTFPVPYPLAGYGGGSLLLSLSEQYLLFSYYSGQSEEAYRLFKISNCGLECVYESGYHCGECASYIFSGNEEFLIQVLPRSMGPWYMDDAETNKDGVAFFEFGEINILNMGNKILSKHLIYVYPSNDWNGDMTEEPFYISEIVDDHILHIIMPWGEEELVLPLNDIIAFKPV
ncbi:MAG: hypothetical protein K2N51_04965 [Lachnospiraceae bacterium]|nr:hypothetical protein [Lachnospiraceae bacterium]